MTLGMLFTAIFIGFCGVLSASRLYILWGVFGGILGFVVGSVGAYIFLWVCLVGRLYLFFPLPLCRRGVCCGYEQYDWPIGTVCGWGWWGIYYYRCNCGDKYIRKGKRFMIVLPDNKTVPFKRLVKFRRWVDDDHEVF